MGSHDIDKLCYVQQNFEVFINIWPDDGLVRPELAANIWNNKIRIKLCQTE